MPQSGASSTPAKISFSATAYHPTSPQELERSSLSPRLKTEAAACKAFFLTNATLQKYQENEATNGKPRLTDSGRSTTAEEDSKEERRAYTPPPPPPPEEPAEPAAFHSSPQDRPLQLRDFDEDQEAHERSYFDEVPQPHRSFQERPRARFSPEPAKAPLKEEFSLSPSESLAGIDTQRSSELPFRAHQPASAWDADWEEKGEDKVPLPSEALTVPRNKLSEQVNLAKQLQKTYPSIHDEQPVALSDLRRTERSKAKYGSALRRLRARVKLKDSAEYKLRKARVSALYQGEYFSDEEMEQQRYEEALEEALLNESLDSAEIEAEEAEANAEREMQRLQLASSWARERRNIMAQALSLRNSGASTPGTARRRSTFIGQSEHNALEEVKSRLNARAARTPSHPSNKKSSLGAWSPEGEPLCNTKQFRKTHLPFITESPALSEQNWMSQLRSPK